MSRGRKPPVYITWLAEQRRAFEDVRLSGYEHAAQITNGKMLNEIARDRRVDSWQVWRNATTATLMRYASPELLEHLARYPRLTFDTYVEQIIERTD